MLTSTSGSWRSSPSRLRDGVVTRFNDAEIEEFARDQVGFTLRAKLGYSTYFVITRVLHPLLVAPQDPRFDAPINKFAREIQDRMDFKPGIGSNTLWVFEKEDGLPGPHAAAHHRPDRAGPDSRVAGPRACGDDPHDA